MQFSAVNITYSPHTWSWTVFILSFPYCLILFSTHVELNRFIRKIDNDRISILHTRGVEPYMAIASGVHCSYSPHTWSWTAPLPEGEGLLRLFSTHVELNRSKCKSSSPAYTILHTRGVEPYVAIASGVHCSYSPHTWSWTAIIAEFCGFLRLFSTHVELNR